MVPGACSLVSACCMASWQLGSNRFPTVEAIRDVVETSQHHVHAVRDSRNVSRTLHRAGCPLEIVDDRQNLPKRVLDRSSANFVDFLA